jgi:hypothetical protein
MSNVPLADVPNRYLKMSEKELRDAEAHLVDALGERKGEAFDDAMWHIRALQTVQTWREAKKYAKDN